MEKTIITLLISLLPCLGFAQKITFGSCIMKDGGQYRGEMMGGKPNGKGNTMWQNGDTYEGEYVVVSGSAAWSWYFLFP